MPIFRYFVVIGSVLLVLLFAADAYLPSQVDGAGSPTVDKTAIRIRSARILPEKIVLDTSTAPPAHPAAVADVPEETAAGVLGEPEKATSPTGTVATAPAEPPTAARDHRPARTKQSNRLAQQRRTIRTRQFARANPQWRLAFGQRDFFGTW